MRTRRILSGTRRRAMATAASVLLLGLLVPASPVIAAGQLVDVSLDVDVHADDARGSIAYLREKYGVSEAEALRRLRLQLTSRQVHEQLTELLPDSYAGMTLDQANGGVLILHGRDQAKLRDALRDVPDRTNVKILPARWSLKELTETRDRLDSKINQAGPVAEVVVDVEENVVAVYQRDGADQIGLPLRTGKESDIASRMVRNPVRAVADAVAAEHGIAVHRQLVLGPRKMKIVTGPSIKLDSPVASGCDPRTCQPPMRGGMRLDMLRNQYGTDSDYKNPWWGQCTNGFNMYDYSRGWNYIMTAGHCTVGAFKSGQTNSYRLDLGQKPVGYEVANFENGPISGGSTYPQDYAIQPYNNSYDFWSGPYAKNRVVSWCYWSVSTWQGCVDGTFSISGYYSYSTITVGWIVCGTGTGDGSTASGYFSSEQNLPGTKCGEVTSKDGGVKTNICTRPGDSGGPLFSELDGAAYGILSNGTDASGACPSGSNAGSERSWYSPIDKILTHVKNQTVQYENKDYQFTLRAWP